MKNTNTKEYRSDFQTFKNNVCHMVKDMGDLEFIVDILESNKIREFFDKKWYPEALYLLAMIDYLSRENDLPICLNYNDLRQAKLNKPIYPTSVIAMSSVAKSDEPKNESFRMAIPEFKRFNIVEAEVRNVI